MYKIKKNRTIIIKKRKKQKISLIKFLNYYIKKYRKIPKKFPVSFDEYSINDTVLEINLETDKKNIKIYNSLKNFKSLEKRISGDLKPLIIKNRKSKIIVNDYISEEDYGYAQDYGLKIELFRKHRKKITFHLIMFYGYCLL